MRALCGRRASVSFAAALEMSLIQPSVCASHPPEHVHVSLTT